MVVAARKQKLHPSGGVHKSTHSKVRRHEDWRTKKLGLWFENSKRRVERNWNVLKHTCSIEDERKERRREMYR